MSKPNSLWHTLFFPYLSYVSLFLGMGLISGAIVHMPVSPTRYALIMMIGVGLFGFATFVSDVNQQEQLTTAGIVRSLGFSLLVSVGIGMISGGIQHWEDNPTYSALLIPLGFGLSLFSFLFKHGVRLNVRKAYALVVIFVALAIPLRLSLVALAADGTEAPAAHGTEQSSGHGH